MMHATWLRLARAAAVAKDERRLDAAAYELARGLGADPLSPVLGWMAASVYADYRGLPGSAMVDDAQLTIPGT